MELFKGQSLLEFTERFKTDLDCEEYLAFLKREEFSYITQSNTPSKVLDTRYIFLGIRI
ncbi:hypothetical protein [Capnocytophaga sp. oral taxon 878]|uniref:hypothetical protein n=1 Tax=Capnocytophaga sp. oral taxon 878 TaxID=1316596 RepID=UPI0013ED9B17|nr:hypothetical protein [Capnocytophaga sp. oral taxon 878]